MALPFVPGLLIFKHDSARGKNITNVVLKKQKRRDYTFVCVAIASSVTNSPIMKRQASG